MDEEQVAGTCFVASILLHSTRPRVIWHAQCGPLALAQMRDADFHKVTRRAPVCKTENLKWFAFRFVHLPPTICVLPIYIPYRLHIPDILSCA